MRLVLLLVATAVLYVWNLGATGYANSFYAAAVQASTRSPVAWLFASVDAPGFITIDKPPLANWWMGLWANILGFSPWSLLLPQATLGVASVAALVMTVRRWSGDATALGAGAVLALTPVAVIMFRYDEPDPMLVLLLVVAAYALVRAVDAAPRRAGGWWLIVCGLLVGLGFLTKMGVALLVVPAFTLGYLVVANVSWRRRVGQLAGGLAGLVVGAGWFLVLVSLWPASARPWIGGSTNNSLWQLAVGYNGVSRLLGRGSPVTGAVTGAGLGHAGEPGGWQTEGQPGGPGVPGGGGHGLAGFGGHRAGPGPLRMFAPQFAGQISWLLPAALLAVVALLWVTRRAGRTDRLRASTLLWGTWLLVALVVLSFMRGSENTYYPVVMSPPLAALVALGAREGWRRRQSRGARALLVVAVTGSACWSWRVLGLTPTFVPWLRWVVLLAGIAVAALFLVPRGGARGGLLAAGLVAAGVAAFAGPVAYAMQTVASPHPGIQVAAGPPVVGAQDGEPGARHREGDPTATGRTSRAAAGAVLGRARWGQAPPDPALDALLRDAGTTWSAAVPSTMTAASLELSSNTSVMGIGGFTGADPTPTLARFQAYVTAGKIHYLIPAPTRPARTPSGAVGPTTGHPDMAGTGGPRGARDSTSIPIIEWTRSHYQRITVGRQTVYDLTKPTN